MKRVFLSFSFRPEDRDLVHDVEQLLASHDLAVVTGRVIAGGQLTEEIMKRIQGCDALVALATRGAALNAGGYVSHPWVLDEIAHARSIDKKAVAVFEDQVQIAGAWAQHERIDYRRDNPLPAFLRLSETVGSWKRSAGRTVKIQLRPSELAHSLWKARSSSCMYRLVSGGIPGPWIPVTPIPEPGGTSLWIAGVQDDHLIQVSVKLQKAQWQSPAASQWMPIELTRLSGGAP
jgi:hypothetical protein